MKYNKIKITKITGLSCSGTAKALTPKPSIGKVHQAQRLSQQRLQQAYTAAAAQPSPKATTKLPRLSERFGQALHASMRSAYQGEVLIWVCLAIAPLLCISLPMLLSWLGLSFAPVAIFAGALIAVVGLAVILLRYFNQVQCTYLQEAALLRQRGARTALQIVTPAA